MKLLIVRKFILSLLFIFLAFPVLAAGDGEVVLDRDENFREIIDQRCYREQLLQRDKPRSEWTGYAQECKIDENFESELYCLREIYPEEGEESIFGEGGFNLFGVDIEVNERTIPSLIRAVVTVIFAIVGITALWIAAFGYYKWIMAVNDSADATAAWKMFQNGLIGILFSVGAVGITWLIFWAAGYGGGLFDFDYEFDELLDVDCEALSASECSKYNVSCSQTCIYEDSESRLLCEELECFDAEDPEFEAGASC